MVATQVEKFAAAREKEVEADAAKGVSAVLEDAEPQFDVAKFAGIFAAIGLVKRKRWKFLVVLIVLLLGAGAVWQKETLNVWWDRLNTGTTSAAVKEPT